MIGIAIIALASSASPDEYRTPEAQAGAVSYVRAVNCARERAGSVPFESPRADELAAKVVSLCQEERGESIRAMAKVLAVSERLATDHVTSKMKIAADDILIKRLESGEALQGVGDGPLKLNAVAASYISCLRTSLNRKMEGIYLGEDWVLKMRGLSPQAIEQEFLKIGHNDCPITRFSYSASFQRAIEAERDKYVMKIMQRNYLPEAIEHMAVSQYVSVVPK